MESNGRAAQKDQGFPQYGGRASFSMGSVKFVAFSGGGLGLASGTFTTPELRKEEGAKIALVGPLVFFAY